jgi:hypothetical protein
MTFYAKPTNRPLVLKGWFEKPKNRLFGHVRVNTNKIHNEKFNYIKFWCDLNVIIRIECIFL